MGLQKKNLSSIFEVAHLGGSSVPYKNIRKGYPTADSRISPIADPKGLKSKLWGYLGAPARVEFPKYNGLGHKKC